MSSIEESCPTENLDMYEKLGWRRKKKMPLWTINIKPLQLIYSLSAAISLKLMEEVLLRYEKINGWLENVSLEVYESIILPRSKKGPFSQPTSIAGVRNALVNWLDRLEALRKGRGKNDVTFKRRKRCLNYTMHKEINLKSPQEKGASLALLCHRLKPSGASLSRNWGPWEVQEFLQCPPSRRRSRYLQRRHRKSIHPQRALFPIGLPPRTMSNSSFLPLERRRPVDNEERRRPEDK